MLPFRDGDRRSLLYVAAVLCAAPVLLLPLAGRSTFELREERAAFDRRFVVPVRVPSVAESPVRLARDPFVADSASAEGGRKPATSGSVTVQAVITGPSPRALVAENARTRIVGIGDVIAGVRIAFIDRTGIRLQNGTLLPLEERDR